MWSWNQAISLGLMISEGAETKRPSHFWTVNQKSKSSKLSHLPLEAEIEFFKGVLPVDVWGLLEHQWTLWKVFDHYAHSEMVWNSLPKSTYSCLKWNLNSWLEVLQFKSNDLYHPYEVCWWCLNHKTTTCSSQTNSLKFKAVFASLKVWKATLSFSCF